MNKNFLFIPYKQIGDLVFGMPRDDVKKICGECRFSRMYGYPVEDRYLDDYGYMHTLCSNKQLLEAIEFFPDISVDDIYLEYDNQLVYLSKDIQTLMEQLHKITDDIVEDEDKEGYSSKKLGLKIYCPDDIVEDVIIHDLHCYDEEEEYIKVQGL